MTVLHPVLGKATWSGGEADAALNAALNKASRPDVLALRTREAIADRTVVTLAGKKWRLLSRLVTTIPGVQMFKVEQVKD